MIKKFIDKYYAQTKGMYPFFKYCPEKYHIYYINKRSSETLGYEFNYLNPHTLNEKIRWLIYNEKPELKSILTDKIKVKTYINERLGSGRCVPIYGIWNKFDEIEPDYLPPRFVLKTNHAWRTNLIVSIENIRKQKSEYKKLTDKWLKIRYNDFSLEPQYKNIKPKLFAEKLIATSRNDYRCDYQVHCFNGVPVMIEAAKVVYSQFYDLDWKRLPYEYTDISPQENVQKPEFLKEMLECAKILSDKFSYVRIDFSRCNKNAVIFEMTFTPFSAMMPFADSKFDFELGKQLELPV